MTKPYRLVIFDWEGTLGDTLGQILFHVAEQAKRLHFGPFDEASARQYASLGLAGAIAQVYPHLSTTQHEQLMQAVSESMCTRHGQVFLIPGAKAFVQALKHAGFDLAVASNKGQQSLLRALQATGMDKLIHVIRCAGQIPAKPCPQMLEEILAVFQYRPSDALMIGDSVEDMEMAAALNIDAIGVSFYQQDTSPLVRAGAMAVFTDYEALGAFFSLSLPAGGSHHEPYL